MILHDGCVKGLRQKTAQQRHNVTRASLVTMLERAVSLPISSIFVAKIQEKL